MNVRPALAILILAASSAVAADPIESAPPTEVSVSLGLGLAYEVGGLELAYRAGHVEGYLGLGLASFLPGASVGGRYFVHDDGSGFFVGLNLAAHGWSRFYGLFDNPQSWPSTSGVLAWATVTPGYRFAWDKVFVEAAIGGGFYYSRTTCPACTPADGPPVAHSFGLLPDATLAVGLRF